jgi:TonB-dependent SusC/RagA subfamily outer membrane receptor
MKKLLVLIVFSVFTSGFTLMAQTNVITGTVTSSVQKEGAILGVTVTVKGTTVGVLTDLDGKYSLSVPQNATTLVFSYLGMKKQEIEIGGRKAIDVVMVPDITSLNEVVVTAMGIVRQEKALGYSTIQVKAKDLVQAKQINVVNGLTAKVSGLQVTTVNNGLFAPTRITLRGNRSLTGNNEALIIVDGSIYYNDISNLNPDDIESINILKGASASANYGSDASNGVLVITTKKEFPENL